MIVDLHLRELVEAVVGPRQPHLEHSLLSGTVVQDSAQRFCRLRLAHDSLRHGVHSHRLVDVTKGSKVEGQRGHLLGQLRTGLSGHAKADQQILLVGQIGLNVVLIPADGIGIVLCPLVNIVPDFSEHHVEFVLHFLHFGGKGNTVFDGTSDASHRER